MLTLATSTAMIAAAKRESDSHRRRAEAFEKLSRASFDRLGSQTAELLADVPGAENARRQLLEETLKGYQRFAANAHQDPELQNDLAVTLGKIGNLQSELGAGEKAVSSLRLSEKIYARLVAESPNEPSLRRAWSIGQNNLARSLHRHGRIEEAASWFARAIANQERLVRSEVNDEAVSAKRDLSATLNNLGLLLADTGATEEAESTYGRAIKLLETTAGGKDSHQLASLHSNLAGLLARKHPQRAAKHARQALDRQTELLREDPGDERMATHVMVSLNHLGTSFTKMGDHLSAIDAFDRSIELGRGLHRRWPEQPKYRRDLVIALNQRGLSLSALGQLVDASNAFEEAVKHQRVLAKPLHRTRKFKA